MKKEFIPYDRALKLKTLGFDEPCFGFYLEDGTWTPASYSREGTVYPSNTDLLPEWCAAPLYQQAFRWFREKYGLQHDITLSVDNTNQLVGFYIVIHKLDPLWNELEVNTTDREEAELACLEKLIEIVERTERIEHGVYQ
jgi:hypothetical protein